MSNSALAGKVCVVTGAAQGIGAAYARRFAAAGVSVAVLDLTRMTQAEQVVAEIEAAGGTAVALQADVRSPDAMKAAADQVLARFGRIDCLVNNAALYQDRAGATWQDYLDVNVQGTINASNAVIPHMWEQRSGSIVNIGSVGAQLGVTSIMGGPVGADGPAPVIDPGGYGMSKWMIIHLTRAMARRLGPRGIRVNAVAPGVTMSVATANSPLATPEELDRLRDAAALKTTVDPEDLTGLVLFLASDDSRTMTGQTLVNDAGLWLSA